MGLPLDGVRVLGLAHRYPDPYATMLRSGLGIDVVPVERPGGGDPARAFGGFHAALTCGNRSVALDVPALGEHTAEVPADAGPAPGRIEALRTSGAACEVPS